MTLRNAFASLGILGLMTIGAAGQPTIKNVPAVRTSAASGEEMYNEYCAVCHGLSGKGDGPAASALNKTPTDLTQLTAKNAGKFPDARVALYIRGDTMVAAHGSRDMPIWGNVFHGMDSQDKSLGQLRVSNLTDYVKSLQAK